MQHFIVIDFELDKALLNSKKLEENINGDWVYFDVSNGTSGKGLYRVEQVEKAKDSQYGDSILNAHDDFLNHFLGLFTPTLETHLSVYKAENFKDFCTKINDTLHQGKKIFDLSRKNFWIWHEAEKETTISMGQKLKDFLEIT